jgi:hypothetical protein
VLKGYDDLFHPMFQGLRDSWEQEDASEMAAHVVDVFALVEILAFPIYALHTVGIKNENCVNHSQHFRWVVFCYVILEW